ncbi:MAG: type III PLP-dependent enzyme [Acetobacter sp.]|nr:type III PLP-dependent enzyme [Acetobacter sp.]
MNPKIAHFILQNNPVTPCLIFDVDEVENHYQLLRQMFPKGRIYYAVKANPAMAVLKRLVKLGACFDAASWEEIALCLEAGAQPNSISFGNTIKKVSAIRVAYAAGIRLFAFDCREELEKIAQNAPGSLVYCRLLVDGYKAEWPLSRKFGTTVESAHDLMCEARTLGLDPYGLSFHVGSQQLSVEAYEVAIARVASLFEELKIEGVNVRMLNLGGGFPVSYADDVPSIDNFTKAISNTISRYFGDVWPEVLLEPGRFIVGKAGVVYTEAVLVSARGARNGTQWIYLDIGRFGGLAETENESIRYAIHAWRGVESDFYREKESDLAPVVLAGPTCDGADILYEKAHYMLPQDLKSGDKLIILSAGAYVSTYCSTCFNGFPPLAEYYI